MFEKEFRKKAFISSFDKTADWYLVREGRENAPCIIKLHGHGSNGDQLIRRPDVMEYQTSFLVQNDYNVISPNLRGNSWMNKAAVHDLYEIIQTEKAHLKWSRLYFISGSMGGTGALIFAMHHPELFSGVGVLGAATDLNSYTDWLKTQKTPILQEIYSAIIQAFPSFSDRFENSVLHHPERFTMPIVYYHGGADEIIPVEQAVSFAGVMKGHAGFMYKQLAGGNHDSPLAFFREAARTLIQND